MGRRLLTNTVTLTIASGQTESNAVEIGGFLRSCAIFAPMTLPETVTVKIEPTPTGTTFRTLLSGPDDVTVPAGKAVVITEIPFAQVKLVAGSAVGADRVFSVCLVVG